MAERAGVTMPKNRMTPTDTTAADLDAFRQGHPADGVTERVVAADGAGQAIIQTRYVFEIFRFYAADLERDLSFDVRGIKRALVAGTLPFRMVEIEITDPDWVEHIRTNGGVETKRMASLTAADLERPGIAVYWPQNNYTTIIDGNNRLVRRFDDGLRTFRMALTLVAPELEPFVCASGDEEKFVERDYPAEQPDRTRIGDVMPGAAEWEPLHPKFRPYMLGSLPAWLHLDDPRPAAEQLDAGYKFAGGWQPSRLPHTLGADNSLHYPGDPPLHPLACARLRGELVVFYAGSWVAIIQPDRTFQVCRMD
jgi:hypothetical protein